VTSEAQQQVAVIDVATNSVIKTISVGLRPRFTEFSRDGKQAFVSGENDGSITVVDAIRHERIRTLKLQGELARPVGMATAMDTSQLYVVTGRGKNLLAVDIATGKLLRSVEVGARPWGIAVSPDGTTLFTANGSSNDVSVVDARTFKILRRIPVGDAPWGAIVVEARASGQSVAHGSKAEQGAKQ
jgi:YVTN family beta-propeller protein